MADHDTVQDLDELIELDEGPDPSETAAGTNGSGDARALVDRPEFDRWRRSCSSPDLPAVIVDRSLQIAWTNEPFRRLFAHQSLSSPVPDEQISLLDLYRNYLGEESTAVIERKLQAAETGFSWWGRVEYKVGRRSTVFANMTIVPLFGGGTEPLAYSAIFNDVSEEYRGLLQRTFQSLLQASKLKDNDTGQHVERVNRYARLIAEELNGSRGYPEVDDEYVHNIGHLTAMHDVGKIGTPDDILNKSGSLSDWEWEVMREHTINGAFLLATYPNPLAREIALRHHEQWDGSGYPHGLGREQIPLCGRIVTIGDVYDALRMQRHYKPPLPHEEAAGIIRDGSGSHFEPALIELFDRIHEGFRDIFDSLVDR